MLRRLSRHDVARSALDRVGGAAPSTRPAAHGGVARPAPHRVAAAAAAAAAVAAPGGATIAAAAAVAGAAAATGAAAAAAAAIAGSAAIAGGAAAATANATAPTAAIRTGGAGQGGMPRPSCVRQELVRRMGAVRLAQSRFGRIGVSREESVDVLAALDAWRADAFELIECRPRFHAVQLHQSFARDVPWCGWAGGGLVRSWRWGRLRWPRGVGARGEGSGLAEVRAGRGDRCDCGRACSG